MKKALMITAIIIVIFILTGCFIQEKIELKKQAEAEELAFNKTKEEIIKFDKEYWDISEEYRIKVEENNGQKKEISVANITQKEINRIEKDFDNYEEYSSKFKSLSIPEPLDDFYYIKIEEFQNVQNQNDSLLNIIKNYDEYSQYSNEHQEDLVEEIESYTDKANGLRLEAQKLQREVYREYALDNLIQKWQN